jgi:chromosome segregation protein
VEFGPEIRPAVEYLLGRVLVTKDLDTALQVGRAAGLRYLVVTAEGDVVRPGGAVSGGREERSRGLLRRQRELSELTVAVKAAEEQRARLVATLDGLGRQAEQRRVAQERLEAECQASQVALAGAEREEAVRISELRQAEAARERLRADLAGMEAGAGRQREEELRERLAVMEEARQALEAGISGETIVLRELAERREAAAEELTAARVGLAELEKDAEAALAAADRARAEAEALVREVAAAVERATDLERRTAETAQWSQGLAEERAQLGARRAAAEDRAAALGLERAKLGEALVEAENGADGARLRHDEAKQLAQEADLEATRAELEAENVASRLAADWGVERAEALSLAAIPGADRAKAAERAEAMRRKLKAVGTVDPESIGEYAALAERHGFLAQQYDDLTAARESLADVLAEIETATTRRFTATFHAVQEEFQTLFKQVFGGGRAVLRLTDPGQPAESGIEVEVQPPGKKNQSLLSLSSGERTMTALSLLFAMMRVRPAPFCVLDEVDAALDEANLERFIGLLRDFAAGMQFIVITHRRPTMEAAGVLYGVTMEEPGTSQLVSVRLAEAG